MFLRVLRIRYFYFNYWNITYIWENKRIDKITFRSCSYREGLIKIWIKKKPGKSKVIAPYRNSNLPYVVLRCRAERKLREKERIRVPRHMHAHIRKRRYIHIDHLLSRHVHHDGTANKYYSFGGCECSSGFLISVCNSRDSQIFLFHHILPFKSTL